MSPHNNSFRAFIIALALAGTASSAIADDKWTGAYLGASAGSRILEGDWRSAHSRDGMTPEAIGEGNFNLDHASAKLSLFAGYNFRVGTNVVIGLEGDVSYGRDIRNHRFSFEQPSYEYEDCELSRGFCGYEYLPSCGTEERTIGAPDCSTALRVRHTATVASSARVRAGFLASDNLLIYGTAGVAMLYERTRVWCEGPECGNHLSGDTKGHVRWGWSVGGGFEYDVGNGWTGRTEYRFSDFGKQTDRVFTGANTFVNATRDLQTHSVTAGIAYKY